MSVDAPTASAAASQAAAKPKAARKAPEKKALLEVQDDAVSPLVAPQVGMMLQSGIPKCLQLPWSGCCFDFFGVTSLPTLCCILRFVILV